MPNEKRKATNPELRLLRSPGRSPRTGKTCLSQGPAEGSQTLVARLLTLTLSTSNDNATVMGEKEVVQSTEQTGHEIILLDMPGTDTLEVLRVLKTCDMGRNARIVVISGVADEALRAWADLFGADTCLTEP